MKSVSEAVSVLELKQTIIKHIVGSTSMILGAIYLVGGAVLELMWLQVLAIVMALYGIYLTSIRK